MKIRVAVLAGLVVVGLGAGPAEAKAKPKPAPKAHTPKPKKKPAKVVKAKEAPVTEETTPTTEPAPVGPPKVAVGLVRQQGCDDGTAGDTCFYADITLPDDEPAESVSLAEIMGRFTYELKPGGPVPGTWQADQITVRDDSGEWVADGVVSHAPATVWVHFPKPWVRGSGQVTFDGVHRD